MGAGRPQKPDEIKKIQGTLRNSRQKNYPKYPIEINTKPPAHLSPRAKKIWKTQAPRVMTTGVLKNVDVEGFELYCSELAKYWEIDAVIKKLLRKIPRGESIDHDKHIRTLELSQKESLANTIRLMSEYGLTPVSRQKINLPEPPKEFFDPMDD